MTKKLTLKEVEKQHFKRVIHQTENEWHKVAAKTLGITLRAFRSKAKAMGLLKSDKPHVVQKAVVSTPVDKSKLIPTGVAKAKRKAKKHLTLAERKRVIKKYNDHTLEDLAKEFGVTPTTIHNIYKRSKK